MTPEDIKKILVDVLEERARVTPEVHGQHHEWIAQQIKESEERAAAALDIAKAKRDLFLSMAKALAGTGMVALGGYATGLLGKVWDAILAGVKL